VGGRRRALEGLAVDPGFWSGRRVLVTGHTGFKGSWLALWLASMGADVTGFSTAPPTSPSLFELAGVGGDVESVVGDVRDAGAVDRAVRDARPEVLLHLAAQPLVRASYDDPVATWDVNVLGTVNVLQAARSAELHSAVVVTSDKCYDNQELGRSFVEDDPLGGRDPYSSSKAAQEIVAAAFRGSYGLPVATGRAGNVIGGGDFGSDRLVPDAMRAAAQGRPLRVRNPDAIRPWQHVLCPLHGYLLLAERAASGPWNFGPADGDARPVRWVADRLGVDWAPDGGDHPHEAHFLRLDSTRARAALGWAPRWDLERGLDATAEWYAAHRDGGDVRELVLRQIHEYARERG
jgi:CDP-glucose 4,6-dehydratase